MWTRDSPCWKYPPSNQLTQSFGILLKKGFFYTEFNMCFLAWAGWAVKIWRISCILCTYVVAFSLDYQLPTTAVCSLQIFMLSNYFIVLFSLECFVCFAPTNGRWGKALVQNEAKRWIKLNFNWAWYCKVLNRQAYYCKNLLSFLNLQQILFDLLLNFDRCGSCII